MKKQPIENYHNNIELKLTDATPNYTGNLLRILFKQNQYQMFLLYNTRIEYLLFFLILIRLMQLMNILFQSR